MSLNLSVISFDDVFKSLRLTQNRLGKFADLKSIDAITSPLQSICSSIGPSKPYKPLHVPEEYLRQWENYLSQNGSLEPRAIRYLCWEPEIASDKKFIDCVDKQVLSARSLQGLVRACHIRWNSVIKENIFMKDSVLEKIRKLVKNYKGPNQILARWNASLDTVLSDKGPELFAREMVNNLQNAEEYAAAWAIDVQSFFFRNSMLFAIEQCKHDFNRCKYLFSDILPWQLWGNAELKKLIGGFILDDYYNNEPAKEILQNFVLLHGELGDPRLDRNNRNWMDVHARAKDRFIQWLSRLDIEFFFEHVLPDRKDPHERKSFWLKYVPKLRASRPLLCYEDQARLRTQLKDKVKVGHFGKIKGINSAFILDFGQIKAVEFSRVGACYIYAEREFNEIVPDLWSGKTFTAENLKDKNRCISDGRIIHRRPAAAWHSADWRRDVESVLARYGVRP